MFILSLGLLLALFVAVFATQNATVVPVRFFGWYTEASLVLVILASALAGALVVGSIAAVRQIGSSLREWELRSRIGRLEAELRSEREKTAKAAGGEKPGVAQGQDVARLKF